MGETCAAIFGNHSSPAWQSHPAVGRPCEVVQRAVVQHVECSVRQHGGMPCGAAVCCMQHVVCRDAAVQCATCSMRHVVRSAAAVQCAGVQCVAAQRCSGAVCCMPRAALQHAAGQRCSMRRAAARWYGTARRGASVHPHTVSLFTRAMAASRPASHRHPSPPTRRSSARQ